VAASGWGGGGGGGGGVGSLDRAHFSVNEIGDWKDEVGFGGFICTRWISAHFRPSDRESNG
jgi:hypothetical protein